MSGLSAVGLLPPGLAPEPATVGSVALLGATSTQTGTSDARAVVQTHTFAGPVTTQSATAGTGTAIQTHVLAAVGTAQINQSTVGSIDGSLTLTGATTTQPAGSAAASITQRHVLHAAACLQSAQSRSGSLTSGASVSLEEQIQALLSPCASGGAHQDIARQGVVPPYIVWQRVISVISNSLAGASGLQNTRLQVDCYAATPALRRSVAGSVVAAFAAAELVSLQLTAQNLYEPDTKLYRALLEFSVWSP